MILTFSRISAIIMFRTNEHIIRFGTTATDKKSGNYIMWCYCKSEEKGTVDLWKKTDNYSKWNFTLVELLFVIAIIAVLASLMLPALQRARNSGKQMACLNNLKTLGACTSMYGDDYNSYYPYAAYIDVPTYCAWQHMLAPYCTKFSSWDLAKATYYQSLKNT